MHFSSLFFLNFPVEGTHAIASKAHKIQRAQDQATENATISLPAPYPWQNSRPRSLWSQVSTIQITYC